MSLVEPRRPAGRVRENDGLLKTLGPHPVEDWPAAIAAPGVMARLSQVVHAHGSAAVFVAMNRDRIIDHADTAALHAIADVDARGRGAQTDEVADVRVRLNRG